MYQNEEYCENGLLHVRLLYLQIPNYLNTFYQRYELFCLFFFFPISSQEQSKPPFPTSSGKLSSDAVTQITTESPEKTTFSSEIFINVDDYGKETLGSMVKKSPKFASSSSIQEITSSLGKDSKGL